MSFTAWLEKAAKGLDPMDATAVAAYRDRVEQEIFDRFAPVITDFLSQVVEDAVSSYAAGTEALVAAVDPFSFTQVQKRWYAAVRRLASVADLDPSEAFVQYTLNGADIPSQAYTEVREILGTARAQGWTEYQTKRALSKQLIPKQGDKDSWANDRARYRRAIVHMARAKATDTANREVAKRLARSGTTFKKWVARNDERTRLTHRAADGQVVPVSSDFTVGGFQLAYPGDMKAPIQETANCRCVMVGTRKLPKKGENMPRKYRRVNLTASIADLYENDNLAFWQGILTFEGQMTGDGRVIEPGAITWDTPLPLRFVAEDTMGHDGARDVGVIQYVERVKEGEDTVIRAGGFFDLGSPEGAEAFRQVKEGVKRGVSVDLDDVVSEYLEPKNKPEPVLDEGEDGKLGTKELGGESYDIVWDSAVSDTAIQNTKSARLRGATLVSIPAFKDAKIFVAGEDAEELEGEGIETPTDEELTAAATDAENFEGTGEEYGKNWVEKVGGLPSYIRRIAEHLQAKGMGESHAIASAVNTVKRWARGGGDVNPLPALRRSKL